MDNNGLGSLQGLLGSKAFFFEVFVGLHGDDSDLFGDGTGSGGLVACDHDDLDACGLAFLDSEGDTLLGRVHQRDEPDEDKILSWEVKVIWSGSYELVAFMINFFIKRKHSEAQHSLSVLTES